MSSTISIRAIAGCFALACFSVALIAGLASGRDASGILSRAILALLAGQVIGALAGWALSRVFREAFDSIRAAHPIPPSHEASASRAGSGS